MAARWPMAMLVTAAIGVVVRPVRNTLNLLRWSKHLILGGQPTSAYELPGG